MKISRFSNTCQWRTATLAALFLAIACLIASTQDFSITGVKTDATGKLTIRHQADQNFYYILLQGETITNIALATDIALATNAAGEFVATAPVAGGRSTAFFRVRKVPLAQPQDTDGDGIDDVWELRFRRPGAALNGFDSGQDQNGNGIADSLDYLKPVAYFAQRSSVAEKGNVHQMTVRFSRPYSGKLLFKAGGTAQQTFDYTLTAGALISPGSSSIRSVDVSSAEVTLGVDSTLGSRGDGDRQVLLSLIQPADNAYFVGQPSVHSLALRDSVIAVYTMALVFTNGISIPSQAFTVSLRSKASGEMRAQLDVSAASMFPTAMSVPVEVLNNGAQFQFSTPLQGMLTGPKPGGTLPFELQFSPAVNGSNVFVMPALLQVSGLSASGKPSVARGAAFITKNQRPEP